MDAHKSRILIVDDDWDLVNSIAEGLEFEGFETMRAHDGVGAIEMIKEMSPDLVILDLNMPGGTGPTVLMTLRSRPDSEHTPVIILTGVKSRELEKTLRSSGVQDYILKPCDVGELVLRIRALLPPSAWWKTVNKRWAWVDDIVPATVRKLN